MSKLLPFDRFFIYALRDPRTGEPRYIGQSSAGMKRPKAHALPSSEKSHSRHLHNWVCLLKGLGLMYETIVIERFSSAEPLDKAESYWIRTLREQGYRLLNVSDGGGATGLSGRSLSEEHKTALRAGWISRKAKGLVRSREDYAAQGLRTRGRKQSAEWVKKRTDKLRGRSLSGEQKRKLSEALKGRPAPENTARNLRKMSSELTPEYVSWMGRKGSARRWGKEFNEPEPRRTK